MKKILLVGRSHAGAIKLGLDLARKSNLFSAEIEYLVMFSQYYKKLKYDIQSKSIIYPDLIPIDKTISDLRFPVQTDNYSKIIIAHGKNPISAAFEIAQWSVNTESLISDSLLHQCFFNIIKNRSLTRNLLNTCAQKCIYIGAPREAINTNLDKKRLNMEKFLVGTARSLVARIEEKQNIGSLTSVIFPPSHLLDSFMRTKSMYARCGVNAHGKEHLRSSDFKHMNADYGFELVKKMIERSLIE